MNRAIAQELGEEIGALVKTYMDSRLATLARRLEAAEAEIRAGHERIKKMEDKADG